MKARCPDWGSSRFSFPPCRCWDSTSIRPRPLPSKIIIHLSSYHCTLHNLRYWKYRVRGLDASGTKWRHWDSVQGVEVIERMRFVLHEVLTVFSCLLVCGVRSLLYQHVHTMESCGVWLLVTSDGLITAHWLDPRSVWYVVYTGRPDCRRMTGTGIWRRVVW
jgi:hypothetical protein